MTNHKKGKPYIPGLKCRGFTAQFGKWEDASARTSRRFYRIWKLLKRASVWYGLTTGCNGVTRLELNTLNAQYEANQVNSANP
jgi:hypothetical protein